MHLFAGLRVRDFAAARPWYVAAIASRGLEPAERERYANGVRKVIYRDPDGNEIGFGGSCCNEIRTFREDSRVRRA
jgi:hypothetical protein